MTFRWQDPQMRFMLAIGGIVLLLLCLLGLRGDPVQFFSSYLIAFSMWLGVSLGCTTIWMIYNLTGGRWGEASLPIFKAASQTLPLMLLLYIPNIFALRFLYPWAQPSAALHAENFASMTWYLNKPFFFLRAALCFLIWLSVAFSLRRRSLDKTQPVEGFSGMGILLFAATMTVAAFDWILSLSLFNHSTIFGLLVILGQVVSSFAFIIFALLFFKRGGGPDLQTKTLHDLANLLFTVVVLWTYLSYSQLIITWSGQKAEEVVWYNSRFMGGWGGVGALLIFLYFVVPFSLLLFRSFKTNPRQMRILAGMLVLTQWLNTVWLVLPTISPMKLTWSWMQCVAPVAVGALWLAAFMNALDRGAIFALRKRAR